MKLRHIFASLALLSAVSAAAGAQEKKPGGLNKVAHDVGATGTKAGKDTKAETKRAGRAKDEFDEAASASPNLRLAKLDLDLPDGRRIAQVGDLSVVGGERTLLKGLASLQLGTVARLHGDTLERHRYWRVRYPDVPTHPSRADGAEEDAWLERLDAAYTDAGARVDALCAARGRHVRLMSTGGLDTRAVAGMLATRSNTAVEVMSWMPSKSS